MGVNEDGVRLSRLGRLPATKTPDLSLPVRNEGILISSNNSSLDSIQARVNRNLEGRTEQKMDAFLQAQLAVEKKAAYEAHREQLRIQTNSRSKTVFKQFKRQYAERAPPKKPWRIAVKPALSHPQREPEEAPGGAPVQGSPGSHQPRLAQLLESAPPLGLQAAEAETEAGSKAEGSGGEAGEPELASSSCSLEEDQEAATAARSEDLSASYRAPDSVRSDAEPARQAMLVVPDGIPMAAAAPEAGPCPSLDGTGGAAWSLSGVDDASAEGDSFLAGCSEQRDALMSGEIDELTIREGLPVVMEAREDGCVEANGSGRADSRSGSSAGSCRGVEPVAPWLHPLGDPPEAFGFESSVAMVAAAGERARANLARHAAKPAAAAGQGTSANGLGGEVASGIGLSRPAGRAIGLRGGSSSKAVREGIGAGAAPAAPEPSQRGAPAKPPPIPSRREQPAAQPSWTPAVRATYEARAREAGIVLPPLCACGNTSPLDPEYPMLCCRNCPLFRNRAAWETMVRSMLAAYGIL